MSPSRFTHEDTPQDLRVRALPGDSPVFGHRPGSPYVEAVWLGVLGPSATLCWARLARQATAQPETTIASKDLAVSLGLGDSLGRNAALSRTLGRLVAFGTAERRGDIIAVRRTLPDVPAHQLPRLSPSAQVAHDRWHVGPAADPPAQMATTRTVDL